MITDTRPTHKPQLLRLFALLLLLLLSGCASTSHTAADGPYDPFEKVNRKIFDYNMSFDKHVLQPVAKGYAKAPAPVRKIVANFFNNLLEPTVVVNDVLQGKLGQAASDTGRFVFNTTFGIGGLFDVASKMGMERNQEDFGQSFAVWGAKPGAYLVLPLLGPSNVRDAFGRALQIGYMDPLQDLSDDGVEWSLRILDIVNTRAQLLGATEVMDQAALDPYVFAREAYRQQRLNLIHDGNPPLDYLLEE